MTVVARPESVVEPARPHDSDTRHAPAISTASRAPRVPGWVLPTLVVIGVGLRLWRTTTNGLTFDESYTALTGLHDVSGLLAHLRATDLHPPLDYLLRSPLAHAHASDFVLRLPSVVFSSLALGLFAWWMRTRGWLGVVATALLALNVFQVFHGGEVRMYALMQLLGVAAAVLSDSWLQRPMRWHPWVLALVVTLAVFDHVSGFFLAAGVFAVAELRTDARAWKWRAAIVGSVVVWAVAWGPTFLDQRRLPYSSWMPRTSFDAVADVVAMQLTDVAALAVVVLAAFLVGGWLLLRREGTLGRVWLWCGALPFLLASLAGVFEGVLWDRSLTCASWAVPLAVAATLGAAVRWRPTVGGALTVGVVAIIAIETITFFAFKRFDYDLSVDKMASVVEPGDVIAVQPALYLTLFEWRIAEQGDLPYRHVSSPSLANSDALRFGGASPTGRTWVLTPAGAEIDFPRTRRCAPTWTDGVTQIACRERRLDSDRDAGPD